MDAALSQADTGYMTKIKNSENSRWRTATILKMVNHDESFNFDDIWYVDVYFDSQNGRVAKKSKFSKSKTADGRHRFWQYNQHHIARLTQNLEGGSRIACDRLSHLWHQHHSIFVVDLRNINVKSY